MAEGRMRGGAMATRQAGASILMASLSNHEIAGRRQHRARRASPFDRLRMRRFCKIDGKVVHAGGLPKPEDVAKRLTA